MATRTLLPWRRMAMAAPLIALGIFTSWLIFRDCGEIDSMIAGCPDSVEYSFRFGNATIDHFLCSLVLFFRASVKTRQGVWIAGYLLSLATSAFAFMAVEASRYGHSWLLSFTPIFAFLFQVAGISVVVPAIWLPVYILTQAYDRSPQRIWTKKVSPQRAALIKFGILFMELVSIAMLIPLDRLNKDVVIVAFQFVPVLCPLLWLPFITTKASDPKLGHRSIIYLHSLQAGGALLWHVIGILLLLDDISIPSKTLQLLWHHPGPSWCSFFLLIDCVILFAALVYLAVLEDGILVALLVLLGTPLVGPAAALSLYYVYREEVILKLCDRQMSKNKQQ